MKLSWKHSGFDIYFIFIIFMTFTSFDFVNLISFCFRRIFVFVLLVEIFFVDCFFDIRWIFFLYFILSDVWNDVLKVFVDIIFVDITATVDENVVIIVGRI